VRSSSKRTRCALTAFAILAMAGPACSGRNIHPELKADPAVAVRQWALQTRAPGDAGDRGADFSNPVLHENALIFGSSSRGLTSLYPGLMQVRWNLPIPGGVVSEVTVEGNTLYLGGADGFLYAVESDTGRVLWRYDLHNPLISRPTVAGGRVFITTADDTVYAFDAGTGKWLWHFRRRTSPSATIHGASAPLVDGTEVLAGLTDGFLVALSINDGQLKWERKLHQGTKFTDVDAHPELDAGILYVPSYDGALYALKRQTGDVLWRFDAGGSKQVLIDGNRLILPSSDGNIYALQKDSAKQLWKFELDGGTPTQLAATDRYLIVGSSHRYLYILDKNTGHPVYRFDGGYGSGFYGSPLADPISQRFYILSSAGNLYSFSLTPNARRARGYEF
jgi:outer membrane protein assembly factor BamB